MHPNGYARYLDELHRLARSLFDVLRAEFPVDDPMPVHLDRVDRLADTAIEQEHVVGATLVCTQLLFRVTRVPQRAEPRQIVALCDIIDQALVDLLEESGDADAVQILRYTHDRICTLSMDLAVLADPGAPDFSGWPE